MTTKTRPVKGERKKKVLGYSASIVSTLAVGIGAGLLAANLWKPPIENVTANASEYALSESYYTEASKTLEKALTSNTPLSEALSPDQLVNIAYRNFGNLKMTKSIGIGSSVSIGGISQEIQSATFHVGERYFEESNSLGIVNIHDRMYQEGDITTTYWGEKNDYANHPKQEMSNQEYATMMGRQISEGLIYIVSPKTISYDADLSGYGTSHIDKTENGYRIEIEMQQVDTSSGKPMMPGITNYQKQMKNISGLKTYPSFAYCHLSVEVDSKGNLLSMLAHEKYDATMPIGPTAIEATCEGALYTRYYSDGTYEIPTLGDLIDYESYK